MSKGKLDTTKLEEKRKRMEQAGWKMGDTQELLGLSDEEMAEIDARLAKGKTRQRVKES